VGQGGGEHGGEQDGGNGEWAAHRRSPAGYAPRDYQTRPDRASGRVWDGEKQDGRGEPGRSPVTPRRLLPLAVAVGDRLLEVEVDPGVRVAGQVAQRGQLLQSHQRRVGGE